MENIRRLAFLLLAVALVGPARAETDTGLVACRLLFVGQVAPQKMVGALERCHRDGPRPLLASSFDPGRKTPNWSAYRLTEAEAERPNPGRADRFTQDGSIPGHLQARARDYRGTGWDRGHLAPAAAMARLSPEAWRWANLYSNVAPQHPALNRHLWRDIEGAAHGWARRLGVVFVIVGTAYGAPPEARIGSSGVAVPSHFFMVVASPTAPPGELRTIAFLAGNREDANAHAIARFVRSAAALQEALQGWNPDHRDLLPAVGAAARERVDLRLWGFID
ncbi:MAG: DNA/RNA non-specific endonuclease [Pseudomonadota bacterium]